MGVDADEVEPDRARVASGEPIEDLEQLKLVVEVVVEGENVTAALGTFTV